MADRQSLSNQLAEELARGEADLNRPANLPAIPAPGPDLESLRRAVLAMKGVLDAREGRALTSSSLERGITLRDLLEVGALTVNGVNFSIAGNLTQGGSVLVPNVGYIDPRPVLTAAPTPTNLTTFGTAKAVILTWEIIDHQNFAYMEVWRNTSNTIGTAMRVGTTDALFGPYTDSTVTSGVTYHYWIRAVSVSLNGSPLVGAFNAVNGVVGATGFVTTPDFVANTISGDIIAVDTLNGNRIVANTIAANRIVANSITTSQIASGGIAADRIVANSITTAQIAAAGVAADRLVANSITTAQIAAGGVDADRITASSITTAQIAAGGVNADRLVAGSITTGLMTANTINGDRIQTGTLNANRIVANSITAGQIASATITGGNIAAGTIQAGNIQAGTITGSNIAGGTITGSNIAGTTIAAGNIVSGTITSTQIASATITGGNIAGGTITAGNIQAGTITGTQIAGSTITGGNIAGTTITAANIAGGTITAAQIATGTITTALMTANTINGDRISTGTLNADRITAGSITTDRMTVNTINGDRISAGTLTADRLNINSSVAIATGGNIRSGQTAFDTGTGFYLGTDSGTPRFSLGSSTQGIWWNGTTFGVRGQIVSAGNISTSSLSAISATLGNVSATSGALYSGGYSASYSWPPAGQNGFHLSNSGLLLGNFNDGAYFQVQAGGDVYAPGFSIIGGNATFSGNLAANTVTANSIQTNAITGVKVNTGDIAAGAGAGSSSVSIALSGGQYSLSNYDLLTQVSLVGSKVLPSGQNLLGVCNADVTFTVGPAVGTSTLMIEVLVDLDLQAFNSSWFSVTTARRAFFIPITYANSQFFSLPISVSIAGNATAASGSAARLAISGLLVRAFQYVANGGAQVTTLFSGSATLRYYATLALQKT